MVRLARKTATCVLAFLLLIVISDVTGAMETDAVQFNATLGFGEYGFDSGYIGYYDALARLQARAYGTLALNLADVTMNGSAWTDSGVIGVDGTSNGGNFSFSLGLEYGAYAYYGIPVLGLDYELDLLALLGVPSMDLLLSDSQTFTPFLLDSSIQISGSLPPQNFGNFDVTDILFPFIPFVGAGVTLDVDMELQESLSGESIYFSNPGSSINSESGTLAFGGSSTILSYYEDADAEVIVGLWPGLYVDAFGWRFDLPIARIPLTVYSSDLPLPFNNSAVNFSGSIVSLNISATVFPSSNVPPYSSVNVSGTVTYNTGENVPVGTVTIDTGYNVYTAAIDNGSFNRNVYVSESSGNISITAEDFAYGLSQTIYEYVSIQGDQGGSGYTLYRTTTCRDAQASSPYDPIYETEWFKRSENQAVVWLHFTDLYESIRAKWEFYEPDGTLHLTNVSGWTDDPGPGAYYEWWKLWASVYIDGYSASYKPGLWSCKIYVDDGGGWDYRETEYFTIGFDFTEHRMAKDVQGSDPYMPINETTVFYQTDTKALTWANCDNVSESFDVKWEYYEPDGSLYDTYPFITDDPGPDSYYDWYRFWGWTMINGYSAANKCGDWHIDVFIKNAGGNYQKIYTDYFQILESPSINPIVSVSASLGSPIETQSVTLNLNATDNTYLDIVELHWKIDGVEQTPETSSNINNGSKSISRNIGSFSGGQQIEYWGAAIDTSGNRTEGVHTTIIVASEVITTPDRPSGEVYLQVGQGGTYTTGGSTSSLGHSVEYEFDWGDGTQSGYGSGTENKSWPSEGYYFVRAHARCQTHTNRESGWSVPIVVYVDSTNPVVDITTDGGNGPGIDFETIEPNVIIEGDVNDPGPTSGLVSVSINTGESNEGTLSNWQFTVDLVVGPNPLTITATDNAGNTGQDTIIVTYSPVPVQYTITASAGPNGVIDPNGTFDVNVGAAQLFTAYPNLGYTVDEWLLDGEPNQIGGTTYTLSDIQANHTVYVTFESTISYSIVGWGSNSDGQCNVPVGNDFIDIVAGYGHGLALRRNGSLEAWGRNTNGQCDVPLGNDFVEIAAWHLHSLAIRNDGSLEAWGWNRDGQCNVPAGNDFIAIAAGSYHSLALRDDGSLEAWGLNEYGTCTVPSGNDFVKIAAGARHNLALKADGSLEAWGYNYFGQCNVPAGNDFIDIAVGHWHSLAIRADGSMAAWGSNSYGQINVPDGNEFVDSAGGWYYTCAIKSDGSLAAWGQNSQGQCNVPVGNNFVDIAAGNYFGLALVRNAIYVDANSPNDPGSGTTDDPYRRIQYAIDAATGGDEVHVAWGEYLEAITMKDGVNIYGGYDSYDWFAPRDPNANETIIDANGLNDSVIKIIDANVIIEGFTITNGAVNGGNGANGGTDAYGDGEDGGHGGNAYGGGMYCENSNLTISNCTFSNNAATGGNGGDCGYMDPWDFEHYNGDGGHGGNGYGGGIYCSNSSLTLTKCKFLNNTAIGGNGGYGVDAGGHGDSTPGDAGTGSGGGIYCDDNSNTIITNCIFNNNNVIGGDGGDGSYGSSGSELDGGNGYGGGIYSTSSLLITQCTLYNNIVTGGVGGGTDFSRSGTGGSGNGGGLYCTNSLSISNCLFFENSANGGDGGYSYHTPGDGGNGYGGGLYCINSQAISNCTLYNNVANGGAGWQGQFYTSNNGNGNGGGLNCDSSQVLVNSILWSNLPNQLSGHDCANVSYCDIADSVCEGINGNISTDPLFVDPDGPDNDPNTWEDNDYHLSYGSPCIDAGDNISAPNDIADLDNDGNTTEPIPYDLDGRDRFADGDCNDTEIVDMGAYEFTYAYFGDFDGECDVDFVDYAILANYWMTDEFLVDIAPTPAGDGIVDERDLAILCDNWLFGK